METLERFVGEGLVAAKPIVYRDRVAPDLAGSATARGWATIIDGARASRRYIALDAASTLADVHGRRLAGRTAVLRA